MMRRGTCILVLATAPWACVIDGVPLPDQTEETRNDDQAPASDVLGANTLYATRSAGVTLVFGLAGTVSADATVVVTSGDRQARTSAADDGSFNVALAGDLGATINVSVLVATKQVGTTSIAAPEAAAILVPDGSAVAVEAPNFQSENVDNTTRVDATNANVVFPAGSFVGNVNVAIANLDRGSTATARAAADGSLATLVKAASGETLYVVALASTGVSSPYIITAP